MIFELAPPCAFTVYGAPPQFCPDGGGPIRRLIQRASEFTGLTVAEIISDRRSRHIARVRFAVYRAAKRTTTASLPMIARTIGRRDHTTVIHGLRRAEQFIASDPEFAALCEALEA